MKKIFFGKGKGHAPFWQPWGLGGCLGRLLGFLALLALLIFLLSLFRKCGGVYGGGGVDIPSEFQRPDADQPYQRPSEIDSMNFDQGNWIRPVEGGDSLGLPGEDENRVPDQNPDEFRRDDEEGMTQQSPDMLYVIFDSGSGDETFRKFASKFGQLYPAPEHKIVYYNTNSKTAALQVPEDRREQIMNELPSKINEVQFMVVPIEMMGIGRYTPNDPAFKHPQISWHFDPIQARDAWEITKGSDDIVIGVVDSFFDLTHPDLKGDRIVKPYSVHKGNGDVYPISGVDFSVAGHGTLVAASAAASIDNAQGSAGIAPKCKIMPVSVYPMTNMHVVEGLLYCIHNGADVINLSLGWLTDEDSGKPMSEEVRIARESYKAEEKMWDYIFKLAEERNVTIVWAAGNENAFSAMDPSKRNKDNTIIVSAVDRNLKKADFSNYGNFAEQNLHYSTVSAPGVDIFGALPGNTYDAWPGTSFAAPIVAGAVGLIKSVKPDITTPEIIKVLQETGKSVQGAPELGPLIQIKDALQKVGGNTDGNFDQIRANPQEFVGTWETTTPIDFTQGGRVVQSGCKIRLNITSPNQGSVVFVSSNGRQTYTAPVSVSIGQEKIVVRQTAPTVGTDNQFTFTGHEFVVTPDGDRKLACRVTVNGRDPYDCYLKKVN